MNLRLPPREVSGICQGRTLYDHKRVGALGLERDVRHFCLGEKGVGGGYNETTQQLRRPRLCRADISRFQDFRTPPQAH